MPSPGQNRLALKRRKLKKRGYDGVTDDQIYQRDSWQCQLPECLCPDGRDLDQSLRGTAQLWAPAIHHIVRLADGGKGNSANKLAAHNRCSSVANRDTQLAQAQDAQRSVEPTPGVVQVRLIGDPDDIDAALAALQAAGDWKVVTRTAAPDPRRAPQEKVIGLLTVTS